MIDGRKDGAERNKGETAGVRVRVETVVLNECHYCIFLFLPMNKDDQKMIIL